MSTTLNIYIYIEYTIYVFIITKCLGPFDFLAPNNF
jgi:hypothetical protein